MPLRWATPVERTGLAAQAAGHARMHFALDQGEELHRGDGHVGHVQFALGHQGLQQRRERIVGALRAGFPEGLLQPVVDVARHHHHAVRADGFLAGDQRKEGLADRLELVAHAAGQFDLEQGIGQHFRTLGLHRRREQRVLVAEVAVDRQLGHPRLGGDLVHADAVEALAGEQLLGGLQDGGTLAQVLGSARAAGGGLGGGLATGW